MVELFIVRHGETEWNVQKRMQGRMDSPLTERGKENIYRLAKSLEPVTFDAVISSPSGRAHETACILMANRNIPIRTDERLMEINLGIWEGKTRDEMCMEHQTMYGHFRANPLEFKVEGGETFFDIRKRAVDVKQWLLDEFEGKRVLIVSHTILIRSLLSEFAELPVSEFWTLPIVHQTSLSEVHFTPHTCKIIRMSDTSHFSPITEISTARIA